MLNHGNAQRIGAILPLQQYFFDPVDFAITVSRDTLHLNGRGDRAYLRSGVEAGP